MRFLGIDPGLGGALACLTRDGYGAVRVHGVEDTPTVPTIIRGRARREYAVGDMHGALHHFLAGDPVLAAVLELAAPMPREGVVSACKIGIGFGLWQALLTATAIPFRIVAPAVWKRRLGLLGLDKNAVRLRAQREFPGIELGRVKDHNRADALYLARYASLLEW